MRAGLKALNALSGSELLDRSGLRTPVERLLYRASRDSGRAAATIGRTFAAAQKLSGPARQKPRSTAGLFDLEPDDEQEMMREAVASFAAEQVRPAASEADSGCATDDALLAQTVELGVPMLGVPEELGGVIAERSAVLSALVAEALAHGDMGIAVAALAPSAVATAIGLYGSADQQATYLPAFTGEDVPAAALAITEPRPLFDALAPATTARRDGAGYVIDGVKSLVPRAADAELFVVGAALEGEPALFVIESKTEGIFHEAEPAMGIRAAATCRLTLESAKVGSGALLGEADGSTYRDAIARSRLAWCALAVGTCQAVVDQVAPYVVERKAFGEPIGHRQAVAFTVADMALELEGLRLATYRAASLADQGKAFVHQVAIARQLCAAKAMKIGSDGVQMYGGHGYTQEYPVERWYRDLRATALMEGVVLV